MSIVTGYMHPGYAESLKEFGIPREFPQCKGWILERQIPGFPYRDAMGCYPLFACQDWRHLLADLEEIGSELVSLALVTDPFGDYEPDYLRRCFGDVVFPFKEHFVADLSRPLEEIVGKRHRKNARRALRNVQVDVCNDPMQFIDEWSALYSGLIQKHNISGISAFSRAAFEKQLSLPGTVVLRATHNDVTVGAQIYFVQGDVVHCHLGAASQNGYKLGVVPALDFYSIEYFSDKVHWLNLGGGAGITSDGTDGLSMYKKGWSTETRTAYFCGRIFDRERYAEIAKAKAIASTDYFPAYRKGEFG
ncbi:MAG: GNAT family N-acetyltransferase [Flavisolibacter sp.]